MPDENHQVDFKTLIPELSTWNDGKGIDIDGWLVRVGSYEHAIAYGCLFWPEFTLHDDCVLFAGFNQTSFDGFMEQTRGNKTAVEAVMNHRHILDLFQNAETDPSEDVILYVGRLLKDIWSAKLRRDFQSRAIVVSFPEDDVEDLLDYEITFFQERNSIRKAP